MKSTQTIVTAMTIWFWLAGSSLGAQNCEALFTFDNTNLTIHFTDLSTHAPNDPIVSWDWDFDDGGTSTQQNPVHTFPEPDRYDVVLTIETQNGCTSTLEIRIETCDFGIDYTIDACDAQGMVPVMLNITDLFDNANEVSITLDGQNVPGSPFPISGQNPVNIEVLVPGNGLSHTIMVQSLDIETCGRSVTFTTDDCTSDCFLSSLQVGYVPGVTHDVIVDDNFFSPQSIAIVLGEVVRFNWAGGGHSTTSDATSGPDSWNSGVIGAGSTFDVEIRNPGTHNYYCIPHGGQGGVGMSGQILSNCPTGTTMDLLVTFNTTVANGQGYNILWDGAPVAGSPFNYNGVGQQSQQISIAGDGMTHTLIVRDVADPTCDVELSYDAPDCGQGGGNPQCSISASVGNFSVCANMQVTTELTVTVANGGLGFDLSIDNGPNTFYSYTGNNTTVLITLPGDGQNHTLLITDEADPACQALLNVVTPDCNVPCGISNLTAIPSSGNGEPSGIIHQVNVEDFQFNPEIVSIAAGDVVQWNWVGAIAHTSTSDISGGANSWDSGLLNNGAVYTSPVLAEGTHPYYCIPHGAPGGVGMSGQVMVLPSCNEFGQVLVQVQFNITNGGAAGYQIVVDGNVAGTFAYAPGVFQSTSVLVAGDGASHTLTVKDVLDMSCSAMTSVVTPNCGGGATCSVTLNPAVNGGCVNNMVPVLLNVTGNNTDTIYSVLLDGQTAGTFHYNNQAAQINVPGDALSHSIIIVDGLDTNCKDTASFITPNCALPCSVNIQQLSFGNNVSHTVEVQDFQFTPSALTINLGDTIIFQWTGVIPHTVTSDLPSGPNAFNSGLLGQGSTWTLVPQATGDFPYYCIPHGAPGGVGMSGSITVTSSCNGNMANGTMVIQYANASGQGFHVLQDTVTVPGSPFASGFSGELTIPIITIGDGMLHHFVVTDVGNPGCSSQQSVTLPLCESLCQLDITQAQVSECIGNAVMLSVSITSNRPVSGYNVYKDGLKLNTDPLQTDATGKGNYTVAIAGNNTTAAISVQFVDDLTCADTTSLLIPLCGDPCLIADMLVSGSGSLHIVEVKDFTFQPSSIDVLAGDTVRFVWTGVVPHTTTSDAIQGPDTWNSGLLSNGAVYDVVINTPGDHRYYCQPHGGPGGIGMSGIIHVTDTCAENQWNANLSFQVSAGSPLGYHVYVDGVRITTDPLQYDDPVGHNAEIIQLPGDGALHTVTIQDMETGFCAYTTQVQTGVCGEGCSILNLTAHTGTGIVHTVEVRDFDYFPAHITVGAGEKIKFVWTGAIPHTVTSDALIGAAVWNSGLLGTGAVYELVIDTPGMHPYFCIPHGGPGGIGMSGTITVLPLCTDNTEHVQLRFEVTNGSTQGYTVFVDGVPFGDNPRQYMNNAGYNEVMIPHPADQMQHIITIQDELNPVCAASDFFTTGSCSADCSIDGLDYLLGNGRRRFVQVRDFNFEPALMQAELGDTIQFEWTGTIPHTVTSDVSQGADVFNSGLLGQGSTFDLVLTTTGLHSYYCIPHGAPGGIGMAGMIEITDPCDDGKVFVDFEFFSSGPGTMYDVLNHNELILDNQNYLSGGIQHFTLELLATGQSHLIRVMDTGTDTCASGIALDSFDCSDPCFLVRSDFSYDINYSNLEVSFKEESRGDVVSWLWNFGDGQTSDLANPNHTFQEAVLYEVCLTVTTSNGCVKTRCDKLRLGAEVCHAGFTYQQDGLNLLFFNTSDVSNPDVNALWMFGDGSSSALFDSVPHTFSLGVYEVCVTVMSPECSHTYCQIIDLSDPCLALRASYLAEPDAENPLLYHFSDISTGDVGSRLWGFGDGQISSSMSPDHLYAATGVYTVCLLTISADGTCTNSDCRSLFVGTTGTGSPYEKLYKIHVVPNPAEAGRGSIQLNGFDLEDLGQLSTLTFYNLQGSIYSRERRAVEESILLSAPELPGLYYLEVISATKRYGVMLVVQ